MWREKYNIWKNNHDFKKYKTRDEIDEVIVNQLSKMLDEMENKLETLAQQPQGEIAATVAELKAYKYHGGDPEFVRLIAKLERQLSPSAADVVCNSGQRKEQR